MEISERDAGDVVVLTLHGRLVLEEVEAQLRDTFDGVMERGRVKVVVNLHDVAYVDSAGLGFLVSKYVSLHRRGGDELVHFPAPAEQGVLPGIDGKTVDEGRGRGFRAGLDDRSPVVGDEAVPRRFLEARQRPPLPAGRQDLPRRAAGERTHVGKRDRVWNGRATRNQHRDERRGDPPFPVHLVLVCDYWADVTSTSVEGRGIAQRDARYEIRDTGCRIGLHSRYQSRFISHAVPVTPYQSRLGWRLTAGG